MSATILSPSNGLEMSTLDALNIMDAITRMLNMMVNIFMVI